MAAFPYHNSAPHAPGFAYLPCVSPFGQSAASALQQARSLAGNSSWSLCYHTHSEAVDNAVFPAEISALNVGTDSTSTNTTITSPTPESSSSLESAMTASFGEIQITTSPSSSWAQRRSEAASKTRYPSPKRKDAQRFASGSADPKVANGYANKSKKPNKRSGATKEAEEQKAAQQPPTGYVHVRARRGEATDSHSLAERVRREKIREKMKTLQDLVPGGDKVVGKALLLEEIIHYVRSLQNQVQFLSMKLASMDPTPYDFGLGNFADPSILLEELENISPELPEVQGTSQIQTTAVADTANRHPVPVPFLLRGEGNQLHLSPGHPSTLTAPCELWPNYAS